MFVCLKSIYSGFGYTRKKKKNKKNNVFPFSARFQSYFNSDFMRLPTGIIETCIKGSRFGAPLCLPQTTTCQNDQKSLTFLRLLRTFLQISKDLLALQKRFKLVTENPDGMRKL